MIGARQKVSRYDRRAAINIGARIREARLAEGLSQQQLADRLGIASRQAINQFEKGRRLPGVLMLVALARVLHVSLEKYLLCDIVNGFFTMPEAEGI